MILNKPSEQELRNMLKKGKTLYQISRHFNTTIKEVHKLEIEYGITRKNKIPKPTKQDLESMYTDEGLTQCQISQKFDVVESTIRSWLRKYKIPTRGSNGTLAVPIPPKEVIQRMYLDEGMTQEQIGKEFGVADCTVSVWIHNYNISTVGRMGGKVPNVSKEVLQRMYNDEGMIQEQIAKEFGVASNTIGTWLRNYNIPTRGSTGTLAISIPPKRVLERMYSYEGMNQYQISRKIGVHEGTVGRWLRNYNIPTRGPNGTLTVLIPPKEYLLNCVNEGLNQHQIAEKCNVCEWKIYDWCKYYDIPGMVNSYRCITDEHINWRDAVFDRDHRTCQKCGASNTYMEAHHIVPFADHPEVAYELENGITLCKQCHESIKGREYDYIEQFAAITQPHLRDHEVIESMPWEAPLPPLSDKLFPDYSQEMIA